MNYSRLKPQHLDHELRMPCRSAAYTEMGTMLPYHLQNDVHQVDASRTSGWCKFSTCIHTWHTCGVPPQTDTSGYYGTLYYMYIYEYQIGTPRPVQCMRYDMMLPGRYNVCGMIWYCRAGTMYAVWYGVAGPVQCMRYDMMLPGRCNVCGMIWCCRAYRIWRHYQYIVKKTCSYCSSYKMMSWWCNTSALSVLNSTGVPCYTMLLFSPLLVLTWTHRYNAVGGHRTGSNNSGAEDYLRRKTNINRR